MTTVYNYKLYCETEAAWKESWGTTAPTTCPTDSGHTITSNSVSIFQTISENSVQVHQPSSGYYMGETMSIAIPLGTPGATTIHTLTFDVEILLWVTSFNGTVDKIGDVFNVIIKPDTPVGGLTATGNIGDTVLNVSSTVTGNVVRGMYIKVTNGITTQDLGKVLAVDATAGTITVKNALDVVRAPGSVLLLNLYLAKNVVIDAEKRYSFGEKGFQGKRVPAETTLTMYYTNNSGTAKQFNWNIGYYFGDDYS